MRLQRRYLGLALLGLFVASAGAIAAAGETRPARATGAAAGFTGMHRMDATVVDFDRETGIVDLKTDVGELKLHFPPAALAGLKKGDAVQVQLGLRTKTKSNE